MKRKRLIKMMPFLFVILIILGCGRRKIDIAISPEQEVQSQEPLPVPETASGVANIYQLSADASQIVSKQVPYETFDENFVISALQENGVIPGTVKVNSVSLSTENEVKTVTVDFDKAFIDYLNTLSNAAEYGTTVAIANTYLDYFNADRFVFRVNNKEIITNNKRYDAFYAKFEGTKNPEFGKFETEVVTNATNEITKSVALFEALKSDDKNVVISPAMLKLQLLSIFEGAEETNRAEIEKYIEDVDVTEKHIVEIADNEKDNYANSFIYHEGISGNVTFDNTYLKSIEKYNTTLRSIDFTKDEATQEANDYVNNLSFEETPNVFEKIDENASIFEVSEFNFNKTWGNDFLDLSEDTFYNYDNSEVTTRFLGTVEELPYFETDEVKGFVKNYKESGYSLIAILPKRTNINYNNLDVANLVDVYSLEDKLVKVRMPAVPVMASYSMQEVLRADGINKIFTFGNANLEKMFTEPQQSFISDIIQFNKFSICGEVTTEKQETKFKDLEFEEEVILDQPFVYIVYNDALDEVVMIGQINIIQ